MTLIRKNALHIFSGRWSWGNSTAVFTDKRICIENVNFITQMGNLTFGDTHGITVMIGCPVLLNVRL